MCLSSMFRGLFIGVRRGLFIRVRRGLKALGILEKSELSLLVIPNSSRFVVLYCIVKVQIRRNLF
jgi:hypothetical protein